MKKKCVSGSITCTAVRSKNADLNLDLKTTDHVIKQYQCDVDKLTEELTAFKQRYFQLKKNYDKKVELLKQLENRKPADTKTNTKPKRRFKM
ncbi:hypothetical protein M8J77_004586 [Diaphorina citri]|nr:hypothetical protein M8J77_004586 [Diaphorina citri]